MVGRITAHGTRRTTHGIRRTAHDTYRMPHAARPMPHAAIKAVKVFELLPVYPKKFYLCKLFLIKIMSNLLIISYFN